MKTLLTITTLVLSGSIFAQNTAIDSLVNALNTSSDTDKVMLLNKLSWEYLEKDIGLGLDYAEQALLLAEKLKSDRWIVQSLNLLGIINNNLHEYENGLICHFKAIHLAEKAGFTTKLGDSYNLIGGIYYNQEDYDRAFIWFSKSLEIRREIRDQKKIAGSLNNVGEIHRLRGDYDRALKLYFQALSINEELSNRKWIAINCINIGETYLNKGTNNEALPYYQRGLHISEEIGDLEHIAMSSTNIGVYYTKISQPQKSIDHFTYAIKVSRKIGARIQIKYALKGLSDAYSQLDRFEESLLYYRQYNAIKDSIFNQAKQRQVIITQTRFETKKKEREITLLRKDKELQAVKLNNDQIIIYAYTGGFIMVTLLAFYLFRGFRQRQKINEQLKDRVELKDLELSDVIKSFKQEIEDHKDTQNKLESINAELNNFMYRSSHDLKAPLASIIGLTNMAQDDYTKEKRLDYIMLISQSTKRLSNILDTLLEATRVTHGTVEISSINFKHFVQQVVAGLENAEHSKGVNVAIAVDKDLQFYSDKKLLTTVMQNLIDNAMKYKNVSIADPHVRITAEKQGNLVEIRVSDNGQGIQTDQQAKVFNMFVRANQGSEGTGLGLYIVKKAVDKLNGKITLKSLEGSGTTFTIVIPSQAGLTIKKRTISAYANN